MKAFPRLYQYSLSVHTVLIASRKAIFHLLLLYTGKAFEISCPGKLRKNHPSHRARKFGPPETAAIETFTEKIHEMRIREPPHPRRNPRQSTLHHQRQPYQSFRGRKIRCEGVVLLAVHNYCILGKTCIPGGKTTNNSNRRPRPEACFHFPVVRSFGLGVQPFPNHGTGGTTPI